MNKRSIAFWNITLFIACIFSIILAYQNYGSHQLMLDLWEEFNDQEIGIDKQLTNKVQNIENNLSIRENLIFNIENHPTELSNVIVFDGYDSRFSGSSKYIYVTAIISSPESDKRLAIVRFRDKEYTVAQGDSIAGGYISSITEKEVLFNKKDKKYKFYRGLDTSLSDEEIIKMNKPHINTMGEINTKKSSGIYSLQSGAYSNKENAESEKNNLLASGFNPRITEYKANGQILYLVHIGFYNDLTSAQMIGGQILSMLNIETIIINNN